MTACDNTVFICSCYITITGGLQKCLWEDDEGGIWDDDYIIAWMPLPHPFVEDESEVGNGS